MRNDQISTESYSVVIADLRAKREELDRTIKILESMSRLDAPPVVMAVPATAAKPERTLTMGRHQPVPSVRRAHAGRSNGIGEECVRILRENASAGPLSSRQVTDFLLASGFRLKAKNPINNVHSALNHRLKVSGDVERVGSNWRYIGTLEKGGDSNQVASPLSQEVNGSPFQRL